MGQNQIKRIKIGIEIENKIWGDYPRNVNKWLVVRKCKRNIWFTMHIHINTLRATRSKHLQIHLYRWKQLQMQRCVCSLACSLGWLVLAWNTMNFVVCSRTKGRKKRENKRTNITISSQQQNGKYPQNVWKKMFIHCNEIKMLYTYYYAVLCCSVVRSVFGTVMWYVLCYCET